MDLRKLLAHNNYILVNKELMHIIGLDETIMLGELCNESIYWEEHFKLDNGYFYSTLENIEKATTFKAKKQKKILDRLQELKLIDVKLKGLPAKRYIKILESNLSNLIQHDQTTLVNKDRQRWSKRTALDNQNNQQILINNNNLENNLDNKKNLIKKRKINSKNIGSKSKLIKDYIEDYSFCKYSDIKSTEPLSDDEIF